MTGWSISAIIPPRRGAPKDCSREQQARPVAERRPDKPVAGPRPDKPVAEPRPDKNDRRADAARGDCLGLGVAATFKEQERFTFRLPIRCNARNAVRLMA